MIENLIEGIKIFKFYVWENLFTDKICGIRSQEMSQRYKSGLITSIMTVVSMGGICLSVFVTFYVYLMWIKKPITLGEIYLVIYIYLSTHVSIVHQNIVSIHKFIVIRSALKRVCDTLLIPECIQNYVNNEEKYMIKLSSAVFEKSSSEKNQSNMNEDLNYDLLSTPILQNLSFRLNRGELLIVIGSVGSGKSLFLQSLLNEYYLESGGFCINGKLSFASEVPWIVSGSVKDNILMGSEYDPDRYIRIIKSCSLDKDIENFIFKDETIIGERGVTLSGGLKARVNLARSLYRNFDIL